MRNYRHAMHFHETFSFPLAAIRRNGKEPTSPTFRCFRHPRPLSGIRRPLSFARAKFTSGKLIVCETSIRRARNIITIFVIVDVSILSLLYRYLFKKTLVRLKFRGHEAPQFRTRGWSVDETTDVIGKRALFFTIRGTRDFANRMRTFTNLNDPRRKAKPRLSAPNRGARVRFLDIRAAESKAQFPWPWQRRTMIFSGRLSHSDYLNDYTSAALSSASNSRRCYRRCYFTCKRRLAVTLRR